MLRAIIVLAFAASANASVVGFSFSGTITRADGPGLTGINLVGETYAGTFLFDTALPDQDDDPNRGFYGPLTDVFGHLGPYPFSFDASQLSYVSVSDGYAYHNGQFHTDDNFYTSASVNFLGHVMDFAVQMVGDYPYDALNGDGLPVTGLDLSAFDDIRKLWMINQPVAIIDADLNSITFIPEPSSVLLVAFGLMCWSRSR